MSFPSNPKIAIIGAGAIGCYYGARLAQQGHSVHFLMRSDFDHVSKHGLQIRSVDGDFVLPEVHVHKDTHSIGPCDLVIVAIKTTANDALLSLLPPLLHEQTAILTLQNGLGNEALLASNFGDDRVLGGLCFVCINRLSEGVIDHQAQGLITIGEWKKGTPDRIEKIQTLFKESRISCQIAENLMQARWKKLVWNIPFNGLSIAAGSLTTTEILQNPSLKQLTLSLMREVISAANHLGCSLPDSLAASMIESTENMMPYKTSSLLDYDAGKEVEVEAIWGEPYRTAKAAGYPMPQVEMLYHLLRHQTQK